MYSRYVKIDIRKSNDFMHTLSKLKEYLILGTFLILAIWLSPFILIGATIYFVYRIRKILNQKKLFEQIKNEWFPNGKYILFIYSDSKKWKEYFENTIISRIRDKAFIWNWSTRQKDGWNDDVIEAKILKLYHPFGYFYPMAIVFLPTGEVKTFQFYSSYVNMLKSGKDEYKKLEKEFLTLADSLEKRKQ